MYACGVASLPLKPAARRVIQNGRAENENIAAQIETFYPLLRCLLRTHLLILISAFIFIHLFITHYLTFSCFRFVFIFIFCRRAALKSAVIKANRS